MIGLDNPLHILMLLVVVLLVFGAKRLPEMGKSLGSGLRGFKESLNGESPASPMISAAELARSSAVEPASTVSTAATVGDPGAPSAAGTA